MSECSFDITIQAKSLQDPCSLIIKQNEVTLLSTTLLNMSEIKSHITLYLFAPSPEIILPSSSQELFIISLLKATSQIFLFAECELTITYIPTASKRLLLSIKGINLDDLDFFDKSDPFFVIFSKGKALYKSEVIWDNLNPIWKECYLNEKDIKSMIKINVWDKDASKDEFIGGCEITPYELTTNRIHKSIHNERKTGNTKSGELDIQVTAKPDIISILATQASIGIVYILSCGVDNFITADVLNYLSKSFVTCEEIFYGFGSAENTWWNIRNEGGIQSIYDDRFIKNPKIGPCLLAPALMNAINGLDFRKIWIICIFPQRDILDYKTVAQIIKETARFPVILRIFKFFETNTPIIDKKLSHLVIKYANSSFRDDIKIQLSSITNEIESLNIN